jgi:hypothetical protein
MRDVLAPLPGHSRGTQGVLTRYRPLVQVCVNHLYQLQTRNELVSVGDEQVRLGGCARVCNFAHRTARCRVYGGADQTPALHAQHCGESEATWPALESLAWSGQRSPGFVGSPRRNLCRDCSSTLAGLLFLEGRKVCGQALVSRQAHHRRSRRCLVVMPHHKHTQTHANTRKHTQTRTHARTHTQ